MRLPHWLDVIHLEKIQIFTVFRKKLLSENYRGDNYISVHSHINQKRVALKQAFRTKNGWFLSVKKKVPLGNTLMRKKKKPFDKLLSLKKKVLLFPKGLCRLLKKNRKVHSNHNYKSQHNAILRSQLLSSK